MTGRARAPSASVAVELVPGVTVIVEAPRPTLTPVKVWLEAVPALPRTESAPSSVTGAAVNVSGCAVVEMVAFWLIVNAVPLVIPVMIAPVPMPVPLTPCPMARPTVLFTLTVWEAVDPVVEVLLEPTEP